MALSVMSPYWTAWASEKSARKRAQQTLSGIPAQSVQIGSNREEATAHPARGALQNKWLAPFKEVSVVKEDAETEMGSDSKRPAAQGVTLGFHLLLRTVLGRVRNGINQLYLWIR